MADILAADIGGTNSRFAWFRAEGDSLALRETKWLGTKDVSSFGGLLDELRRSGFPLRPEDAAVAVVAVAGPVERGIRSAPPFISWDIDITRPREDVGLRRGVLLNDFVAQAYACRTQPGRAAREILPGRPVEGSAVAVIGAGTGLGQAALVPDGRGDVLAVPSEGGHAHFPFADHRECEYQEFLKRELGIPYATGNEVVSGRGLSYVHRFLTGEDLEPHDVSALFGEDRETLRWAARFYGRACRDLVLQTLAQGGLFIAGGVAARTPALVEHPEFEGEFRRSPSHTALLADVPVRLMTDEQSGLWGAAYRGLLELREEDH